MRKIRLITATPTVGGNGDTLIAEAMETAGTCGAEVSRVDPALLHLCL